MKDTAVLAGCVLALFMSLYSGLALAQTPPIEPSDFSASFVELNYSTQSPSNGTPLFDGWGGSFWSQGTGFWSLGISGTATGEWYEDYTNRREAFKIWSMDPKSTAPIAGIWKFYDKQLFYVYNYTSQSCTKSKLLIPLTLFFRDLQYTTYNGQTGSVESFWYGSGATVGLPGDVWTSTLSEGNSIEFGVDNSSSQTPLYVTRYSPGRITQLQFRSFTPGQPDASVFALPAACANAN